VDADDRLYLDDVRRAVNARMFGVSGIVDFLLAALFTGGHVLLEGNPGMGKTELVKALCDNLGFGPGRWGRIQFTPDLMPADITGTLMPDEAAPARFAFRPGPIFRWLVLADEINRATPKTQAAMLEAMGEGQVTVLGRTYGLGERQAIAFDGETVETRPPFMVMATQNPIDQEGTYDLPEAQADRFMVKLRMPLPGGDTLERILDKDAAAAPPPPAAGKSEAEALYRFHRIRRAVPAVREQPAVRDHIVNMVLASNGAAGDLRGLGRREAAALADLHARYVAFGVGPRAAIALLLGAKALALLALPGEGENTNVALARFALPALRHRLLLRFDWAHAFAEAAAAEVPGAGEWPAARLHDLLLARFVAAAAPPADGYRHVVITALREAGLPVGEP